MSTETNKPQQQQNPGQKQNPQQQNQQGGQMRPDQNKPGSGQPGQAGRDNDPSQRS
jgi:hypothetical protein